MNMPGKDKQPVRGSPPPRTKRSTRSPVPEVDIAMERRVGVSVHDLSVIFLLSSIQGLGPQAFKSAFSIGVSPLEILQQPNAIKVSGKRGDTIRAHIQEAAENVNSHQAQAKRNIAAADKCQARIITYWHPEYPKPVMNSNYPVPVLYVRGAVNVLGSSKTVACVGSREIRPPYSNRQQEFAQKAAHCGFTVVSGFALGADSIAHRASFETRGKTICVMAGGLDRPFPPENRDFWNELLQYEGAVFVSEAPFGARATSLTLRKRNKLIVAFALGVMIGQSSVKGGSMNAFRFTLEQRKPIATFESNGAEETSGNLMISREAKVPATTFKAEQADGGAWQKWLQEL